jgi:DNA topoisomerase-2
LLTGEVIKIEERKYHKHWDVQMSFSETEFKQVSFVNSICTSSGGTHVDYIVN